LQTRQILPLFLHPLVSSILLIHEFRINLFTVGLTRPFQIHRQDWTGQYRAGQYRTGQYRTGQDRAGQDRAGQYRTGQDWAGQDRAGQLVA
jgi:hypothetical protein